MLSLRMEITEIYAWIVCLGMRGSRVLWARLNQRLYLMFQIQRSGLRFNLPIQHACDQPRVCSSASGNLGRVRSTD